MTSNPPVPVASVEELYDRYKEYVKMRGVDKQYKTIDEYVDAMLTQYPQLKEEYVHMPDGKEYRVLRGICLKRDTPIAKRLAARGKKYPSFIEEFMYHEWRVMQESLDELERYANSDNGLPPFPRSSKL